MAAEERIRAAGPFTPTTSAATGQKNTPFEQIRIVLKVFRRGATERDLCSGRESSPQEFMEAGLI